MATVIVLSLFGALIIRLGIMAEREMAVINVPIHRANEQARNR